MPGQADRWFTPDATSRGPSTPSGHGRRSTKSRSDKFVSQDRSAQSASRSTSRHCDFVIAVGGDGTALAALHAAAPAGRPVLGVACGSIGVLTSVDAHRIDWALTPLARHGGVSPSLVVGPESRIGLLVESGYGGSRFELDGRELGTAPPRGHHRPAARLRDHDHAGGPGDHARRAAPPGPRGRLPADPGAPPAYRPARRLGQVAPACRQTSSRNTISVESDFLGPNLRMRV
jgi:ATP-NAD kinase N-terminal domain